MSKAYVRNYSAVCFCSFCYMVYLQPCDHFFFFCSPGSFIYRVSSYFLLCACQCFLSLQLLFYIPALAPGHSVSLPRWRRGGGGDADSASLSADTVGSCPSAQPERRSHRCVCTILTLRPHPVPKHSHNAAGLRRRDKMAANNVALL